MREIDAPARVAQVESTLRETFEPLDGVKLRIKGAIGILEAPAPAVALAVRDRAFDAGVHLSAAGPYIRLLPPYTIEPENLRRACRIVAGALSDELSRHRAPRD